MYQFCNITDTYTEIFTFYIKNLENNNSIEFEVRI
jgi:hypothetical protein